MNKKRIIPVAAAAAAVLAGLLLARRFGLFGDGSSPDEAEAPVMSVAEITGAALEVDRFSGVVESQETWSVNQNPEYVVKEVFVETGDEVKTGDPLFVYDEESFQSSLSQAEIDLERLQAENDGIDKTIGALTAEKAKAPSSEQANYTIQIEQQQIEKKQKELEIQSKQMEIDKLRENIQNATVTCGIDGVVQSVQDSTADYNGGDSAFITVMKVGDMRVKGRVNEQNIGQLSEGMEMLVLSRVDDTVWTGTLTTIDRENQDSGQSDYYYSSESSDTSTFYPFYVELDDSKGLMLGQHVYLMEKAKGGDRPGIWLDSYYVEQLDSEEPFVWKNNAGTLVKQPVVIAEQDEEMMRVRITEGLAANDEIAAPDETLREGMTCVNITEQAAQNEPEEVDQGDTVPGIGAEDGMMMTEPAAAE